MKGRKSKSADERELGGNAGHRQMPGQVDIKPLDTLPKHPSGLKGEGKTAWYDTGTLLVSEGRITALQLKIFEAYCYAVYHHRKALKDLEKNGYTVTSNNGNETVSPMVTVVDRFTRQMTMLAEKLGIPMADYARIKPTRQHKKNAFADI